MNKKSITVFSTIVFSFLLSCQKKENLPTSNPTTTPTDCDTISYQTDIAPLMSANCTSCHNANQASAGINLSTYANVSKYATSSLNAINDGSMPPAGKLSADIIKKFSCWISQGKLNN
jgi:cytochrome c553